MRTDRLGIIADRGALLTGDRQYLRKIAQLLDLTCNTHGASGATDNLIDDGCEACKLVVELEEMGASGN